MLRSKGEQFTPELGVDLLESRYDFAAEAAPPASR
jgi:hypothetical protein